MFKKCIQFLSRKSVGHYSGKLFTLQSIAMLHINFHVVDDSHLTDFFKDFMLAEFACNLVPLTCLSFNRE